MNYISSSINEKRLLKLHNNKNHPVCQLKEHIQSFFIDFDFIDNLPEIVTVNENFDDLPISFEHPTRLINDTYFIDEYHVLRTHTSMHQVSLLKQGHTQFIVTADVYRKNTIDKDHYPVFHQMNGVKILSGNIDALGDLINTIAEFMCFLFPRKECRITGNCLPFANPSIKTEVWHNGIWMRVLDAGVVHSQILHNCGIMDKGWSFSLGIDNLLLVLCNIPDIRYLWTTDKRFMDQFKNGLTDFKEYSKYQSISRDISLLINDYTESATYMWEHHNDFCEIARETGKDLIESITVMDKFSKANVISLTYRIIYKSNDKVISKNEIDDIQEKLRLKVSEYFNIKMK